MFSTKLVKKFTRGRAWQTKYLIYVAFPLKSGYGVCTADYAESYTLGQQLSLACSGLDNTHSLSGKAVRSVFTQMEKD